jgi:hypothetical protein
MKIRGLDETLPVYDGSFQGLGSLLLRFPFQAGRTVLPGQTPFSAVQRLGLRGARDNLVRSPAYHRTICGYTTEEIILRVRAAVPARKVELPGQRLEH